MAGTLGTIMHLLRGQQRRGDQAEKLRAFYGPQAAGYDGFRERLLHGRRELVERMLAILADTEGPVLAELGAGTGKNIEYFGAELATFARIDLVDLCPALLDIARSRAARWPNVNVIEADAIRYRPADPIDAVLFSYSLTMMPDWRGLVENAAAMLRQGGTIGVVDFTVSSGQSGFARRFWQAWFGHDGVRLEQEHVTTLRRHFPDHQCEERRCPLPYLPGFTVPYYLFIGRKT